MAAHPEDGSRSERSLLPQLPEPAPYVARTRKWALAVVAVASFVAAAIVASPLAIAIIFGGVMAISARRPYRFLCRKMGEGRRRVAAALVTLACGLLLAVVGSFILLALTNELMKLVAHLNEHGDSSLAGLIGPRASRAIGNLGVDTTRLTAWAQKEVESAAAYAAGTVAVVFRTMSEAVLGLVVALMTMYYALGEGRALAVRFERIAPLEPRHTRALLIEAREVGRTAFIGTVATAAVQGLLAGIGYATLGVSEPVTWALVTALASFLPVIGTLVVWVPMSAWLLIDGHPVKAVILAAWGIVVITSLADYVIRPRLVGGRAHGHPLLTLIALLGGIEIFGLAGLIIAPIVMSVFVAALRIYEREMARGGVPGAKTPIPPIALPPALVTPGAGPPAVAPKPAR